MDERQRMRNAIRDPSPCKGCAERFTACSDKCPKDARGEYGHKAWKAEINRVKGEKRKYLERTYPKKYTRYGGLKDGEE